MQFEVLYKSSNSAARLGRLHLAHGTVETPVFMPVGTRAAVKAMTWQQVHSMGYEMVLANTFHLHLRPGDERVRDIGGLHHFMGWSKPILTDSGGYQVFSLSDLREISEKGVHFASPVDGQRLFIGPEEAIRIQQNLGADIIMAFDECTPYPCEFRAARDSMEMTLRWAERCKTAHGKRSEQSLFGIVQGSVFADLRKASARQTVQIGFPGYAIGGLSVGEPKDLMYTGLEAALAELPTDRPRYAMGVGTPWDFLDCVERGVDMFDCVMPTRVARNGRVYVRGGKMNIRNARYADDIRPLDEYCQCEACQNHSRAYLRHLHQVGEIAAAQLLTIHNLHFFKDCMDEIRKAVRQSNLADLRAIWHEREKRFKNENL